MGELILIWVTGSVLGFVLGLTEALAGGVSIGKGGVVKWLILAVLLSYGHFVLWRVWDVWSEWKNFSGSK